MMTKQKLTAAMPVAVITTTTKDYTKEEETMHLKEGRIYTEEWDSKVIPAIANGPLRERKDLAPKGFLVVHQIFDCVIEEDGKLFSCTAWSPPDGEHYVDVKRYEGD